MQRLLLFVLLCVALCGGKKKDAMKKDKPTCDTVFCAKGQECVETKDDAHCECVEKCTGKKEPVCGSNGTHLKTYENECFLYREACLEEQDNRTITFVANTPCDEVMEKDKYITKKIEMDSSMPKPVVCMENDRNNLRKSIINWINERIELEEEMSYKGMLLKYFQEMDTNKDQSLDTMEFMKLVEEDMSISEILSEDDHSNPILRGLCVSELMAITDANSDYKLEFDEFHRCLDPDYEPPKEYCELNGKEFSDGEDVPQDCNTCKCACGHWVCTHLNCDKNSAKEKLTGDKKMK